VLLDELKSVSLTTVQKKFRDQKFKVSSKKKKKRKKETSVQIFHSRTSKKDGVEVETSNLANAQPEQITSSQIKEACQRI